MIGFFRFNNLACGCSFFLRDVIYCFLLIGVDFVVSVRFRFVNVSYRLRLVVAYFVVSAFFRLVNVSYRLRLIGVYFVVSAFFRLRYRFKACGFVFGDLVISVISGVI